MRERTNRGEAKRLAPHISTLNHTRYTAHYCPSSPVYKRTQSSASSSHVARRLIRFRSSMGMKLLITKLFNLSCRVSSRIVSSMSERKQIVCVYVCVCVCERGCERERESVSECIA